ncbi:MAG TPA: glycosyltransferase family 39 protein [Candidatus Udaeobacter sp.]|nr:glycosyltransferase family 39 protein [Candidatus Udaeobacter sp.]
MRDAIPAVTNQKRSSGELILVILFSAVALLIHLLTNSRYGYFRDELYYIACARHLAFGYVDQPPLSILLLRLNELLLGSSLFAIRFLPALAGAATVAITGLIARELGGRAWAIALGCAGSLCALFNLAVGNFFSMNAFEPLFWMGCVYLLVRIINGGSSILWLWFGVLLGLGLENKHSTTFFAVGICAALLLTPERRHFAKKWIWFGGLIAFVIALPNILWQAQHHWPTYELLSNIAHSNKNVALSPAQFIVQQIVFMNPGTLPLWLSGLIWVFGSRHGRHYMALGIIYLVMLAEFVILHGKSYYLAPAYPMLLAAGGVAVERVFANRLRWCKAALLILTLATGALVAPLAVPILPPAKLIAYMQAIGLQLPRTETSHTAPLPQIFADQFGWQEMAASVGHVYDHLRPDDKKRVAVFCQNYGEAGAIDFFGPKFGLPPAISGHQNYFLWGPRDWTGEVALVLDTRDDGAREQFASVEDLGQIVSSPWAMPFERRTHIYLCHDLKSNVREFWPRVKKWL